VRDITAAISRDEDQGRRAGAVGTAFAAGKIAATPPCPSHIVGVVAPVIYVASLHRAVAPVGCVTSALIVRDGADLWAAAAVAAGVPGAGGGVLKCDVNATRNPPRLAQSAGVPGVFTNVPLPQSATALSDGGSAEAGVTIFCGAGGAGVGALAGTRTGAGVVVAGAAVTAGREATRGGGGGAPCAAAREVLNTASNAPAAVPIMRGPMVMDSP
jgi:hypothetical protein